MAGRSPSPKLLNNLRLIVRPTSTTSSMVTTVSSLNFDDKPDPALATAKQPFSRLTSILDLTDHERLFSSLPTSKLLSASANLHFASMKPVVDLGMWVMNSRLMDIDVVRDAILAFVRHTFYQHFCAGVDTKEASQCATRINEAGMRAMLNYAVEQTNESDVCDKNLQGFLDTIESTQSVSPSSVSSVIVKITAICPLSVLQRVSDLLRWEQKDPSFTLPWKLNTFPIFSQSSPMYHTLKKPEPLTQQEEEDLQLAHKRLLQLCQRSVETNVPLVVDAEETQVQPAIDYLTYNSAIMYNKKDSLMVYGTIQAYLKDAKERLFLVTKRAEEMGVPMGLKLVRGAYMSSERKLASSLGFESPIHNTIQDTHTCYDDCAAFLLEKIANGWGGAILATHNAESGNLAAAKARELGIEKGKQRLEFAQLYGMSDALSFGLRDAGFQVSKYMPYGPVDKVIPYLLRRAEENRGLLSTASIDRELMRKELKRRLKTAILLSGK